jgi:hypothetical protein
LKPAFIGGSCRRGERVVQRPSFVVREVIPVIVDDEIDRGSFG